MAIAGQVYFITCIESDEQSGVLSAMRKEYKYIILSVLFFSGITHKALQSGHNREW
jgi:hypothetical protein